MYLKRMELMGFKSFPTKTKISFEPGISCIVGPNGSGKSNVSDALRWVLGEQSTKMLRGGKLEDVIFSGSKNRRPLGMAEVSLILDNSDGYLPLEFAEVEVTRRNFRGGLSEYLINNRTCRLKDILDLFVDTGIGIDGLSLINQGRINDLISVRPEERRILVEEAAGIIKYRNRKKEAARKLQETERHLERIGDIIRELASRVDPLREQAAKARQYVDLKQRADKLEIAVSVMVLKDTQEKLEQLQVMMAAECDQFDLLTTQRHKQSALAEQLRLQLTEIDEMVQSLSQEYYGLQSQKEKGEGQRNLAISRRDNGAEKLARLQTELQELEAEAACQREQIAALRVQEDQTALAVGDLESRIAVGAGGEQEWQEEAALLAEQLDEKKEIAYQIAGILTVLHNKQGFQEQLVEKARLRREKLMRQQEEFVQTSQNCKERLAQIVVAMADNTAQSQAVAVDLSEKENAMKQAAAMAQDLAKREGEAKYHNASLKTKVAMRKEMAQSYEGFYPGVRELLRANKKGQAPSGIVDAVANLLEVPTQYRGALELYLGGALQNIVCVSAVAAKEGIAWLKRQDAGRATFLPLDKLRVRAKMDFSAALKLSGVFGCGADLVGCAAAYEPARDFLLNNMLLVKDMDTALKAAEIIHFRASVVTLDGDIINPGASMAGGSRKQKSSDMLSKQSQLKEAEQQFSQAALQLAAITAQLREARENSDAISAHMDQLLAESRQFAATGAELRREQDRVADEQAAAERQWDSCRGEQQSLEDEITEAQDNIQQLQEEYQCREQENRLLLAEIDHFQEKLKGKTATLDQSRQGIARQREDLAALKQKAQGQTAALIKLRQDSETMARAQEEKFADCGAAEKELAVYGDDIVAAERNLTVLARQMLDIRDLLEKKQHGLAAETGRLTALDQQGRELHQQLEQLQNNRHQNELHKTRLEADWNNEEQKLIEKFNMTFAQATVEAGTVEARSGGALSQSLGSLRKQIAAIGHVNIDAIEEYQEVEERFTFLSAQRDDLVEASSQLATVIAEMDTIMNSRFKKAFLQLSEQFNISFRRLFGGGEAALVLSDPKHMLETGVEIEVHPPGKKVNHYNLLSGGEKTMIGIALMFAMLAVRPTPFCMMDEVDAALDEANIERFTSYLQEQAGKSQFVMITHRQSTMEAAAVLWGLTMEEEGVSKVVSVKLNQTR